MTAVFDHAHLDARLTALGMTTQDAAEMLNVKPATMAAWRSGKDQPTGDWRIQLRLFMDEGRTYAVKLLMSYQQNRTTLSRNGESADHSGVTPPYATNDVGKLDAVPVPTIPALPEIGPSKIEPLRDGKQS
jgi:hypothetical protein